MLVECRDPHARLPKPDMPLETGLLKRTLKDLQERTESLRGFL